METLDFFLGDDIVVEVSSVWADTGLPVDLTGAAVTATCRRKGWSTPAWTKKTANQTGGSDSQVLVSTPATGGVLTIFATGADSAAMKATPDYRLDAVAKLASGKVVTLTVVTLNMIERPTVGTIA